MAGRNYCCLVWPDTMKLARIYSTGSGPNFAAVGNFNADGLLDQAWNPSLVVADRCKHCPQ